MCGGHRTRNNEVEAQHVLLTRVDQPEHVLRFGLVPVSVGRRKMETASLAFQAVNLSLTNAQ